MMEHFILKGVKNKNKDYKKNEAELIKFLQNIKI